MDGRHDSFPGSLFGPNDPRNPRINTIIQGSTTFSSPISSGFDATSPGSIDFTFPFSGSPHGSSTSNIDAPPEITRMSASMPGRSPSSDHSRLSGPRIPVHQHRSSLASIDSAFEADTSLQTGRNQWSATTNATNGSPRKSSVPADQDKKFADNDKAPAWSEMKTKAGKERKRLPLACIACRRKKIRCSGEKPACKHCVRARVPCVYKVTTRKAAPRTDYMAMLEKRLKRMEERVIRAIPKDEQPDFNTTGRSSVRPPPPGQAPKKDKAAAGKRSADEAFTQELVDWTQGPRTAIPDPAIGMRKQREAENMLFSEGSESLPPQHIQEHLAEVFFDCVYGQAYLLLHKPSFIRKVKSGTVPPVLLLAVCAVSARFSTHPHVSTEPAFLRGEQWATPARKIIEQRHYEPNIAILAAMLMLGLHYLGTCEGGLSWSFCGQAMRMGYALQLHRELDYDPSALPQAGQVSDQPQQPKKPNQLSFTDREIRRRTMWACYIMDTFNASGTERPSFLNEDYFQIQLPIKESMFQMETPGPTEDLEGNIPRSTRKSTATTDVDKIHREARSNMGAGAYAVRAVVVWKRTVKYLNLGGKDKDPHAIWDPISQFANLQRQLQTLKSSLPSDLVFSSENLATHAGDRLANQFLFLHIVMAQTSLFLHRFAIPTAPSHRPHHQSYIAAGMPRSFLASSANTVIESAATISSIIADSPGMTFTVPFAGYCAYAAATVHIWGIFSRNSQLETSSKENLRHNYRYLTQMKRHWGMFHYMAESVKDIYRAFADAASRNTGSGSGPANMLKQSASAVASGTQTPDEEVSESASPLAGAGEDGKGAGSGKIMLQYGDWFSQYPHGVSEEEWEQSHVGFKKDSERGSESVMSQRNDLQSVEEFFATMSPPSKSGEESAANAGGRRKMPRKSGKSVVENKKGGSMSGNQSTMLSGGATTMDDSSARRTSQTSRSQSQPQSSHSKSLSQQLDQQPFSSTGTSTASAAAQIQAAQQQLRQMSNATLSDIPMNTGGAHRHFQSTDFDVPSSNLFESNLLFSSSPQNPSANQQDSQNPNFDFASTNPAAQFNFNYTSALPHLDRQFVFGAYNDIDPSNNVSANATLNSMGSIQNFDPNMSWDALGVGTRAHQQDGGHIQQQQQQQQHNYQFPDPLGFGGGGSAWYLPFNIDPPTFTGLEDYQGNDGLGGMNLDEIG